MSTPLLEVAKLSVHFPVRSGILQRQTGVVKALDEVSLQIEKGTTLGLVGESGSGKTTLGRVIVRLVDPTTGWVRYSGQEISSLQGAELRPYRKKIQMVFQDPYNSLNPRLRVGTILAEPLEIHFPRMSAGDRETRVAELLHLVGLDPNHARRFPHEFSGGQRQRIGIARALAVEPEFIICDEPVSALDVSVQAQIVNLLMDLQEKLNLTYLFIAHDLAVVEHVSDQIAVLEHGKLVEQGPAEKSPPNPLTPTPNAFLPPFPPSPDQISSSPNPCTHWKFEIPRIFKQTFPRLGSPNPVKTPSSRFTPPVFPRSDNSKEFMGAESGSFLFAHPPHFICASGNVWSSPAIAGLYLRRSVDYLA
ncbi:ABC transporter ATP-binding protein [bacterium]|nr:ABC transporter ATP-binding protein [bacterium]